MGSTESVAMNELPIIYKAFAKKTSTQKKLLGESEVIIKLDVTTD